MSAQCRGVTAASFCGRRVVIVVVIAVVVAGADSEASNAVFSGDTAPPAIEIERNILCAALGAPYLIYTRVRTVRVYPHVHR